MLNIYNHCLLFQHILKGILIKCVCARVCVYLVLFKKFYLVLLLFCHSFVILFWPFVILFGPFVILFGPFALSVMSIFFSATGPEFSCVPERNIFLSLFLCPFLKQLGDVNWMLVICAVWH